MNRKIIVCEPTDQWTKLLRRAKAKHGFSVVRWTNLALAESDLKNEQGSFVAVRVTEQNVAEAIGQVAKLKEFGRQHRFVGLCDAVLTRVEPLILNAGVSACFFSLVDVQSVIRLAGIHFEHVSEHVDFLGNHAPATTVEKILRDLPKF